MMEWCFEKRVSVCGWRDSLLACSWAIATGRTSEQRAIPNEQTSSNRAS